jgi:plasmid stabilization system protein ParE
MKVFISELAEKKLENLTAYLLEEWGMKVKREFLAKLDKKITQISLHPESCPKSRELGGVYRCNVSKQTSFFYRIDLKMQEIEIITFYDVRQDPGKIKNLLQK